jgi:BASS family bile acid:Na+ symporter
LNISLTAVNSLLSLFTLPIIVNLSIAFFMEADMAVPMQFKKIIEVFFIVLIPVSIGMFIHAKRPQITQKLTKPVKILSALFLVLIIAAAIMKERANVVLYFQQVGLPALLFNFLSMLVGYQVPRLMQIGKRQSIAIGMEIGIHNGTLAIYIALSVLGNSVMSIPPAIYSLIMFFTAAIFGYWVNRDKQVA